MSEQKFLEVAGSYWAVVRKGGSQVGGAICEGFSQLSIIQELSNQFRPDVASLSVS